MRAYNEHERVAAPPSKRGGHRLRLFCSLAGTVWTNTDNNVLTPTTNTVLTEPWDAGASACHNKCCVGIWRTGCRADVGHYASAGILVPGRRMPPLTPTLDSWAANAPQSMAAREPRCHADRAARTGLNVLTCDRALRDTQAFPCRTAGVPLRPAGMHLHFRCLLLRL